MRFAVRQKDPKYDLRLKYKKTLELALVISLVLHTAGFLLSKEFHPESKLRKVEQVVIKAEDIPITQQVKRPPPPKRPTIPIEDADTDIEKDATILDTDYNPLEEPPPPPPIIVEKDEEAVPFWAIEEKPEMIGGTQALMDYITKNNLYPAVAQTAETNGDVIVQFTVSKDGNVTDAVVAQEKPLGLGFGDAAVKAILAMKFKPGKQRDKPVAVRMQQTIKFRIK
jgi:protein TonB